MDCSGFNKSIDGAAVMIGIPIKTVTKFIFVILCLRCLTNNIFLSLFCHVIKKSDQIHYYLFASIVCLWLTPLIGSIDFVQTKNWTRRTCCSTCNHGLWCTITNSAIHSLPYSTSCFILLNDFHLYMWCMSDEIL